MNKNHNYPHGSKVHWDDLGDFIDQMFPHGICEITNTMLDDQEMWMIDHFGPPALDLICYDQGKPAYCFNNQGRWNFFRGYPRFKNPDDAVLFRLMWSHG